jgi:hypothetical protein
MEPGHVAKTLCMTVMYPGSVDILCPDSRERSRIQGAVAYFPIGSIGIVLSSPVRTPENTYWVKWMSNGIIGWVFLQFLGAIE